MNQQPYPTTQGGQSPVYGFQPQPQPEYIGFLKQVLAGLMDPRTQALLAPGMALTKAPQAAWNATRVLPNLLSERGSVGGFNRPNVTGPRSATDSGGFNVPTRTLMEQAPIEQAVETPTIPAMRKNFFDSIEGMHNLARAQSGLQGPVAEMAANKVLNSAPQIRRIVEYVAKNQHEMRSDMLRRLYPTGFEYETGAMGKPHFPETN